MLKSLSKSSRKPSATRQMSGAAGNTPPTISHAHLQGFVVGCVAGILGYGVISNSYETDENSQHTLSMGPSALEVEVGPKFDFYTVLPNQELDLNPNIELAKTKSGNSTSAQYLLQVGSFRQQDEADRRRGELALLGLQTSIEPSDNNNGRWYRVYLGPFKSRSEMARAQSLTAQANIDTLLLKRESP